jgi:hypothetical protein
MRSRTWAAGCEMGMACENCCTSPPCIAIKMIGGTPAVESQTRLFVALTQLVAWIAAAFA